MTEITETVFIPEREIWIQPTIVKEYSDGTKIIEYHWQGAEYAHIGAGGSMILDKEKIKEFEAAAEPLIKFLGDNFNPHVTVIVDCGSAELSEGVCRIQNDKFIKD